MDLWRIWYLGAVFCLTCLLFKALQLHRRRQELLAMLSSFPGAPTHWLRGHVYELLPISIVFKKVEAWSQLYPFAFPVWIGCFSACLVITHPDYAKALLARTDPKDNVSYRHVVPWIAKEFLLENKVILSGHHLLIISPPAELCHFWPSAGTMNAVWSTIHNRFDTPVIESCKDKWEQLVIQEKSVELFEHVSLMTLDSIMKCAFSHSSNCQMDRKNSYVQAVFKLCSLVYGRMYSILGQSDLTYWFTPQGFQFRKSCQVAHQHTDEIIKKRKESLKDEAELQKILKKRHLDFLDILLCDKDDKGNPLSDEDLQAEVDTFMFEGHDTTASGISWLLYCMAQNPEHQEKCREEIKAIMGDHDTIQWDDLSKMTYCTMCIKESLRIYPPVPGVSRQLSKPITFFDGRSLPEGAWVSISIHLIHKNPAIWNDPEVFDPLRFSPENTASRNSHAFLPFSAGPRNCIGQQFAMNELKVALAMTLLRFRLLPDPVNPLAVPIPQIVMRSENGIHIRLEKVV